LLCQTEHPNERFEIIPNHIAFKKSNLPDCYHEDALR
jgi:hypothetical protein